MAAANLRYLLGSYSLKLGLSNRAVLSSLFTTHHTLHLPDCAANTTCQKFSSDAAVQLELTDDDVTEEYGVASGESAAKLTPRVVVERLNKFIIGQDEAKRAVAVAFRNRWRRHQVPGSVREDIMPKNILMIGPTGCGKTEIARRLAKLADAPFVKVEASKFTEVGYHGHDVDQIVKDLVEAAVVLVRGKMRERAAARIEQEVEKKLVRMIMASQEDVSEESVRTKLRQKQLEATEVSVEVPPGRSPDISQMPFLGAVATMGVIFGPQGMQGRRDKRRMTVAEARSLLEDAEAERLFPNEALVKAALQATEEDGIVFIDEIDKIVRGTSEYRHGSDISGEGVQRDLLPIIEGSVVSSKHGNVKTDHILFICSGAFHSSKPSDMLAELQGRLPIRVELRALTQDDFYRILTKPQYNMIEQHKALMTTEGVDLHFTDAAVREIAAVAETVNRSVQNIGARRLHTVLERIVEDVSFFAPERVAEARRNGKERYMHVIDKELVLRTLEPLLKQEDVSKYIL